MQFLMNRVLLSGLAAAATVAAYPATTEEIPSCVILQQAYCVTEADCPDCDSDCGTYTAVNAFLIDEFVTYDRSGTDATLTSVLCAVTYDCINWNPCSGSPGFECAMDLFSGTPGNINALVPNLNPCG